MPTSQTFPVYQPFNKEAIFTQRYGTNASRRDRRQFERYWNSQQRIADELVENKKYLAHVNAYVQDELNKFKRVPDTTPTDLISTTSTPTAPEFYKTKDFRTTKLAEMYGTNPSKRDLRQFERYIQSDQGQNDWLAHEKAESQKYLKSWDDRIAFNKQRMPEPAPKPNLVPKFEEQIAEVGNKPELKPRTDWNAIAAEKLGENATMQDVMDLQKQLGVTVDGKWGKQTQAAYDAYQQRMQNEHLMGPNPDFISPGTYFDVKGPSPLTKHAYNPSSMYTNISKSTEQPIVQQNSNQFSGEKTYSKMGLVTDFDDWYIKSLGDNVPMRGNVVDYEKLHATPEYQKSFNSFKSQYVDTGWGGGKNRFVRVEDYQSIPKQFDENGQLTQEYKDYMTNERAKAHMISRKLGGKMNRINYFQQGGQMQQDQEEELKLALTGYVVATKKQPKSEEEVQQLIQEIAMLKQKDPKTYTQLVQLGSQAQQQQQATMAKWGSKLGYIKSLKYAKGGKTCHSCQNGGKPLETPPINKSFKKPIKKVEEKACGGKTKKR